MWNALRCNSSYSSNLHFTSEATLAKAFTVMEACKSELGVRYYAVSQPSLERIFIKFVKEMENVSRGQEAT